MFTTDFEFFRIQNTYYRESWSDSREYQHFFLLRMLLYIHSQPIDSIRISVLGDTTKIFKKLTILRGDH